ncbi:dihydropteroate synthase, partial [Acinetobacter baumannii]
ESTRPGAAAVGEQEELDRLLPVVEGIAARLDVVISVDTSTPSAIRESARLGAGLINDVRSLTRPGALAEAAASGLPVCLMHMHGEP